MPPARPLFYHPASAKVVRARQHDDTGGWLYNDKLGDPDHGGVWVNCTHTDSKAMAWTGF